MGFLLLDNLLRQRVESSGLRIIVAHVVEVRVLQNQRLLDGGAPWTGTRTRTGTEFLGDHPDLFGALRHDWGVRLGWTSSIREVSEQSGESVREGPQAILGSSSQSKRKTVVAA